MADHVAFLRGINLGRTRRVGNAELIAEFEALGYDDVDAYRASGNVLFGARDRPEGELIAAIEERLRESLGYEVTTFVRNAAEVRGIAGFDPFDLDELAGSAGKLQVALLGVAPAEAAREQVLGLATDADRLALVERELYWLPRAGISDSDLDLGAIERLIGPTTIRTKGTIEGIAAKLPVAG